MSALLVRTLLLILAGVHLYAHGSELTPRFDPSYRPDPGTDEGGIWYAIDKLEQEVRNSPQRYTEPALNAYVHGITCQLAGDYCPAIRVYLVRNPNFNAAMYPNGMMIVWTGLLLRTANEAQLAAVLAHELGHFLLAHSIEQWRKTRSGATAAMVLDSILGATTGIYGVATLGVLGSLSSFSRSHESEADLFGLQLIERNGYAGTEAAALWDYVIRESANDKSKGGYNTFLASHPRSEVRAETMIEKASPAGGQARVGQEDYVRVLSEDYFDLMEDHLRMQELGQTEVLLAHHRAMGLPASVTDFFEAEMYRLRNESGDAERAVAAYKRALQNENAPPQAYRELGYLLTKLRDPQAAHFLQLYLDRQPEASDGDMVRFYLQSLATRDNKP